MFTGTWFSLWYNFSKRKETQRKTENLIIRVLPDRQAHTVQTFSLFFNTNMIACSTAKTPLDLKPQISQ